MKPENPRDQWWLRQAMILAAKIGDARWILAQQVGQGTPKAFVALLVFWLTLLFASFALFAPRNFSSAATLALCALAVSGAVGMILELEEGLGGLIHISPQPMRQAVWRWGARQPNEKFGTLLPAFAGTASAQIHGAALRKFVLGPGSDHTQIPSASDHTRSR